MDADFHQTDNPKRKRPPKLKPLPIDYSSPGSSSFDETLSNLCPDSNLGDDALMTSCIKVYVDNSEGHKEFLIKPELLTVAEQLGRGQFGIVEKVYHKENGYQFAVKRVPITHADEDERRRLLMDANVPIVTGGCNNIIKFYGAFIWEGDLWTFMELMDCSLDRFYRLVFGKTNDQSKREKLKVMPENVVGKVASDVVNALSYLHSIKIIHRDVKPSNILISKSGLIKLCDFGISGHLVNSVAKTYDAGCRPYMAPERIDPPRDSPGYNIKSDVWSLGITLVEFATGQYPFSKARDFFEQLKMICSGKVPQLPDSTYSTQFEDFIHQCLQRDVKLRPDYEVILMHSFILEFHLENIEDFTMSYLT